MRSGSRKEVPSKPIKQAALKNKMNFRYIDAKTIGISIDETTSLEDINLIFLFLPRRISRLSHAFVCDPKECEKITTIPET